MYWEQCWHQCYSFPQQKDPRAVNERSCKKCWHFPPIFPLKVYINIWLLSNASRPTRSIPQSKTREILVRASFEGWPTLGLGSSPATWSPLWWGNCGFDGNRSRSDPSHVLLPYCAVLGPHPATWDCRGPRWARLKPKATPSTLHSDLMGTSLLEAKSYMVFIFGGWCANKKLHIQSLSCTACALTLHMEKVAMFVATYPPIMQLHLLESLGDAALALLVPDVSWEQGW